MKIPKKETLWETIISPKGRTYIVTSDDTRKTYFLYLEENGNITRKAKGDTPPDLMKHIDKEDK